MSRKEPETSLVTPVSLSGRRDLPLRKPLGLSEERTPFCDRTPVSKSAPPTRPPYPPSRTPGPSGNASKRALYHPYPDSHFPFNTQPILSGLLDRPLPPCGPTQRVSFRTPRDRSPLSSLLIAIFEKVQSFILLYRFPNKPTF